MIYFTPGPAQLYPSVRQYINQALDEGFCSASHRSKAFEYVCRQATENLRNLLDIPEDYHVFFLSSATEIWERCIQNLVRYRSAHWVNGSFSERFCTTAREMGRLVQSIEVNNGQGFQQADVEIIESSAEMIAVTHNETSTGVITSPDLLMKIKRELPMSLLVVDAVSSLPYGRLPIADLDSVFFSVQKGFGLPAGLGVWIVGPRCIEKANHILSGGTPMAQYHSIPGFLKYSAHFQTPSTPNMLDIYLLAKVSQDMLVQGIDKIQEETETKAAALYELLDKHDRFRAFVTEKSFRSPTVIVVESPEPASVINQYLAPLGMQVGGGYGPLKDRQFRIANFPAIGPGDMDRLLTALWAYGKK